MRSLIVRYGVIAGVVLAVLMFVPWLVYQPGPEWLKFGAALGYTLMALSLSAVYFAIRRDRLAHAGPYTFSRGLAVGTAVALMAGLVFGVATWLFFLTIGSDFLPMFWDHYMQSIAQSGLPPEEMARRREEMENMRGFFFNEAAQGAVMAATVFVIGVALSAISALVLRRRAAVPGAAA